MAVHRDRVAVQLPNKVVLYELAHEEGATPGEGAGLPKPLRAH
mgnify:CR=1 FL=1